MAKRKRSTAASRLNRAFETMASKSDTFNNGFSEIDTWVSSGNYAMNRLMSGMFDATFLYGRNYVLYGESGSGKSLVAAYTASRAQTENDATVVWLDIEKATGDQRGKQWLERAGVNTDPEYFVFSRLARLEEVKKVVSTICKQCREDIADGDEVAPILIIVDSWSAAMTEGQWKQAIAGELTGDMGQKAKQTGDVIQAVTHLVDGLPILVIGVGHIMDNQEKYGGKHKTTGGNKMMFMASGALLMTKAKLKNEDVEDADTKQLYDDEEANLMSTMKTHKRTAGIEVNVEILKSRVTKPFERVKIQIPYKTGMDKYSGLMELMMQEGVVSRGGRGWFQYDIDGKTVKFQKGSFRDHADAIMSVADIDISDPDDEEPTSATIGDKNGS